MVLTEDSGSDAYDTVQGLVREMLKLLVPSVRMNRVDFKPLAEEGARRAMQANNWKSGKPLYEQARRLLIRSIITELLKPQGFVLYHIDGDVPWSRHDTSENVRKFLECMFPPIEAGVRSQRPLEVEMRMKRLRLLVPFYSIESWLYQHTVEARRLCAEEGCGRCQSRLAEWEADRASLDDVLKPKTTTLCLEGRFNKQLAGAGFPADEVFKANASFARAVEELMDCNDLTAALERTWATPSGSVT